MIEIINDSIIENNDVNKLTTDEIILKIQKCQIEYDTAYHGLQFYKRILDKRLKKYEKLTGKEFTDEIFLEKNIGNKIVKDNIELTTLLNGLKSCYNKNHLEMDTILSDIFFIIIPLLERLVRTQKILFEDLKKHE